MGRPPRCFRRTRMFKTKLATARPAPARLSSTVALVVIMLLGLLLSACEGPFGGPTSSASPTASGGGGGQSGFPTTPPPLRTPKFGSPGQVASTVKVLASVDPTLIIQFPLVPASIKS